MILTGETEVLADKTFQNPVFTAQREDISSLNDNDLGPVESSTGSNDNTVLGPIITQYWVQ
jgi:hypothetical protein